MDSSKFIFSLLKCEIYKSTFSFFTKFFMSEWKEKFLFVISPFFLQYFILEFLYHFFKKLSLGGVMCFHRTRYYFRVLFAFFYAAGAYIYMPNFFNLSIIIPGIGQLTCLTIRGEVSEVIEYLFPSSFLYGLLFSSYYVHGSPRLMLLCASLKYWPQETVVRKEQRNYSLLLTSLYLTILRE